MASVDPAVPEGSSKFGAHVFDNLKVWLGVEVKHF